VIEDGLQEGEAAGLVEQNRVGGEGGLHTNTCTKLGQIRLHIPLGYRLGQDRSGINRSLFLDRMKGLIHSNKGLVGLGSNARTARISFSLISNEKTKRARSI
jgi:hypothetical protein